MARRGRKKKFKLDFNVNPETLRSVLAIVLLLLGGISLISFFLPNYSINQKIQELLKGIFGLSSIVVPLIMILSGLMLIEVLKFKFKEGRVLFGMFLLLFASSPLFGLLNEDWGGRFGDKFANGISGAISGFGAGLLFFAAVVIAIILILNMSFEQIVDLVKRYTGSIDLSRFKRVPKDEVDVQISTGTVEPNDSEEIQMESVVVVEPTFEIIPTMAEPQNDTSSVDMSGIRGLTLAPNLPYADKVWELPQVDLLTEQPSAPPDTGDVKKNAKIIKDTLRSFNIDVEVVDIQVGPTVTKYALEAPKGIKVAKISNLQFDLALALASPTGSVRIEAPIPGKSLIGIEVPNKTRAIVNFKPLMISEPIQKAKSKLAIVLGKDVTGTTHVYDIAKMPHLLIAGATGSGKSVFIHNIMFSILFRASPQEVKFILIDPKRVELSAYAGIPHLYTPIVTDIDKAPSVFKWAASEMSRRYKMFESAKVRNIEGYNEKSGFQAMPYILVVVDELAEIMVVDPAAVEKSIIRLAQLARATGIHLILAAQRPSANIITGLIKANIPCRAAFNVTGQVDSRVIIDQAGAEKLLGKGDMLFVPPDSPNPIRLQCANVTDKDISTLVNFLTSQGIRPDYKEEILQMHDDKAGSVGGSSAGGSSDALYDEAVDIVISAGKASASLLQRRLSIGYARSARLLDELEANNIIGPAQGSKPRDVLIDSHGFSDSGEDIESDITATF